MRVVALGGAGDMGRYAVRTCRGFDFVEEVVVADPDLSAAERAAERAGAKARALEVDMDADGFFDALAPFCSPPFETGRQMLALTESRRDI